MPATVDLVLPWVEGSAAPNDNRRQEAGDRRPETGGDREGVAPLAVARVSPRQPRLSTIEPKSSSAPTRQPSSNG